MTAAPDRAAAFLALHHGESPLLMPNPWDAGSAKLLASLGHDVVEEHPDYDGEDAAQRMLDVWFFDFPKRIDSYAAQTGRDYLEPPPELPTVYPKRGTDSRPPRGKGYGKGFDAAVAFWEQTIETPPEVNSTLHMKGGPLLTGIRVRVRDELARTDARDLFDSLRQFIDAERERFHSSSEPYTWGRP